MTWPQIWLFQLGGPGAAHVSARGRRGGVCGGPAPGPRKRRRPRPAVQARLGREGGLCAAARAGGAVRWEPSCGRRAAFLRPPSVYPLPGPALTMDRDPGRAAAGGAEAAAAAAFGDAGQQVGRRRGSRRLRCTSWGPSRSPHFARAGSGCRGGAPRLPPPGLSGVTLQPPVASERKQACPGKAVLKVAESQGLRPKAARSARSALRWRRTGLYGRPCGGDGPGVSECITSMSRSPRSIYYCPAGAQTRGTRLTPRRSLPTSIKVAWSGQRLAETSRLQFT